MAKRGAATFTLISALADLAGTLGGLYAAWWLRFRSGLDPSAVEATSYFGQLAWALPIWLLALRMTHCYEEHPRILSFNRARRILKGCALACVIAVSRNYFMREADVARLLYPLAFVSTLTGIVSMRAIAQALIVRFLLAGNRHRVPILIVGAAPMALRLAARCRLEPQLAYDLRGFVQLEEAPARTSIGGIPVLGRIGNLRALVRESGAEEVFLTQSEFTPEQVERLFLEAEMEGARINVIPSLAEMLRTQIFYDEVAGVPIYSIKQTPLSGVNAIVKRLFDVTLASFGLLLLAPFLGVLWLLLRRQFPGVSPIYEQPRLGTGGEQFICYKFRTMPPDAEKAGPVWGSQEDPRATPLGRFLRRWNIDELPQLWNVLRGDMSLVGPRPERPVFVERFKLEIPRYMARHAVKTGMTGWAQVHGLRGDTSVSQRLRYDLYYVENWSLWLDIKILIMTFVRPKRRPARELRRTTTSGDARRWSRNVSSPGDAPGSPEQAAASAAPSPSPSPAPAPTRS